MKDIFIEEEIIASFGKRNPFNNTSLLGGITNKKEFYGYISLSYKYVFHNHLLEGSLFNNNAPFTIDILHNIISLKAGGSFQIGNYRLKLEHNFNSPENVLSEYHTYNSIALERIF